jgi:hypothetical protein
MKSSPRIRLPDVKIRAGKILLLLALGAILAGVSGCSTDEPANASVRPWNTPQSWEGGGAMPMMNQQHE